MWYRMEISLISSSMCKRDRNNRYTIHDSGYRSESTCLPAGRPPFSTSEDKCFPVLPQYLLD
jgi:hypothetical protein